MTFLIGETKKPLFPGFTGNPLAFKTIEFADWFVSPAWLPMAMAFVP